MRLQDIQNALQNIVHINTGLDEERLKLLLTSAGWDTSDITDAVMLWKSGKITEDDPGIKQSALIVDENNEIGPHLSLEEKGSPDSIQEKETNSSPEVISENSKHEALLPEVYTSHVPVLEEKEETTLLAKETLQSQTLEKKEPAILPKTENKPGALTSFLARLFESSSSTENKDKKEEKKERASLSTPHTPKVTSPEELPHNLPLRPYESTHTTVPLQEYEKRFFFLHKPEEKSHAVETVTQAPRVAVEKTVEKEEKKPEVHFEPAPVVQSVTPPPQPLPRIEPMSSLYKQKTKPVLQSEDKYVILAACMLFLVLLLLLGYMYSNGRL